MTDTELHVPQPNWIQRCLLLSSINIIGRFRHRNGSVLMLTKDLCVKYGTRLDLVEAQTMIYIGKHTSVPVPKVHLAFTHKRRTYILMERIHGQPIGKAWPQRPNTSKVKLLESLKGIILEMRKLGTESPAISSVTGGSLYDPRMPTATGRFGPFKNTQEFHKYLRNGIEAHSNHNDDVNKLVSMQPQEWNGPTFTHGDLSSLNVLVRGDDIVGIIDWETAGWFPSYREYTTAHQVNPQNAFWKDEIDNFLEAMPEALVMEQLRQQYFGDF